MSVSDFDAFLKWEYKSRDIIDFKKIYVDMAGDVLAGLMLSEIVYWYLPSKDGNQPNKLRVNHDGHQWIASTRHEWWERTRLSPREADRALAILVKAGLVIKALYKFNGAPTQHLRINMPVFMVRWDALIATPPENPFNQSVKFISPIGEMNFTKTDKSLTESTASTTAKNKDLPHGKNLHPENNAVHPPTGGAPSGASFSEESHIPTEIHSHKVKPDKTADADRDAPAAWGSADGRHRKAKSPISKPKPPAKPRERNLLFDAVALHVFGISDPNAEGGRIAKIANWLAGKFEGKGVEKVGAIAAPAAPDDVKAFAQWCSGQQITPPRDFVKFVENWRKWAQSGSSAGNSSGYRPAVTSSPATKPLTPQERAELIAEGRQRRAEALREQEAAHV